MKLFSSCNVELVIAYVVVKAQIISILKNQSFLLQKFLKGNEVLQLTAKVDPSLMGGMVVSIGDKYVDMSVASKVKKYTELISAAV